MIFHVENLPSHSRIAIIAGRGTYPILCAKNIAAAGHEFIVIAVDDEVDELWIKSLPREKVAKISVGQVSKLLKILKDFDVKFALMAGQVKPKKLFSGLIPDLKAIRILTSLKEHNAESIFGAIADEISKIGVLLLDARSFVADELAGKGVMSCHRLKINNESLDYGVKILKEVTRLNIGQSLVVRKHTIVAVEDFAGTDDLIVRTGKFRLSDAIFIKGTKFNQDFRFDVPIFGIRTLENLKQANIEFAALEAQKVIILYKENILRYADELGIQVIGF